MKNKFEMQENGSLLGTVIQRVRKAKGLTQEELGKRVGVTKSSISKIELSSILIAKEAEEAESQRFRFFFRINWQNLKKLLYLCTQNSDNHANLCFI